MGFPGSSDGKAFAGKVGDLVRSLSWEDPLEDGTATALVELPGEFHGQRSLAGYSLWGCKEVDVTFTFVIIYNGSKRFLYCY